MKDDEINKINYSDYSGEYSESKLWSKIKKVAASAGKSLIYNVLLLYYVMLEPTVPIAYKTMIIGALGYFILPLDLVPDVIPVAGYADDAAALAALVKTVNDCITPQIKAKANAKLAEWF